MENGEGPGMSSSGLLARPALRPPNGALPDVCAALPRLQHSSALLQLYPRAALLRQRANVRRLPMHRRGRATGPPCRMGLLRWLQQPSCIIGVKRIASIAIVDIAAASTTIAAATAISSICSIASLASTQECAQCPRWLHCRHSPRRRGPGMSTLHECTWCPHAATLLSSRVGPRSPLHCLRSFRNASTIVAVSTMLPPRGGV